MRGLEERPDLIAPQELTEAELPGSRPTPARLCHRAKDPRKERLSSLSLPMSREETPTERRRRVRCELGTWVPPRERICRVCLPPCGLPPCSADGVFGYRNASGFNKVGLSYFSSCPSPRDACQVRAGKRFPVFPPRGVGSAVMPGLLACSGGLWPPVLGRVPSSLLHEDRGSPAHLLRGRSFLVPVLPSLWKSVRLDPVREGPPLPASRPTSSATPRGADG